MAHPGKESAPPLFLGQTEGRQKFSEAVPPPPIISGSGCPGPPYISICLKSFAALLRKYDKFLVTTQHLAHSNLQIACSIFFNKDVSGL